MPLLCQRKYLGLWLYVPGCMITCFVTLSVQSHQSLLCPYVASTNNRGNLASIILSIWTADLKLHLSENPKDRLTHNSAHILRIPIFSPCAAE